MFLFAEILTGHEFQMTFFKILRFVIRMPRSYARPIKEASQPVGNYYFYLFIYLFKKKIKNVVMPILLRVSRRNT